MAALGQPGLQQKTKKQTVSLGNMSSLEGWPRRQGSIQEMGERGPARLAWASCLGFRGAGLYEGSRKMEMLRNCHTRGLKQVFDLNVAGPPGIMQRYQGGEGGGGLSQFSCHPACPWEILSPLSFTGQMRLAALTA